MIGPIPSRADLAADAHVDMVAQLLRTADWRRITPTTMPDDDQTVQLYDADASEPVWFGWHEEDGWHYVDGAEATPSHWAPMSEGPLE